MISLWREWPRNWSKMALGIDGRWGQIHQRWRTNMLIGEKTEELENGGQEARDQNAVSGCVAFVYPLIHPHHISTNEWKKKNFMHMSKEEKEKEEESLFNRYESLFQRKKCWVSDDLYCPIVDSLNKMNKSSANNDDLFRFFERSNLTESRSFTYLKYGIGSSEFMACRYRVQRPFLLLQA